MAQGNSTKLEDKEYRRGLAKIRNANDEIKDHYKRVKLKAKNSELASVNNYIKTVTRLQEFLEKYHSGVKQTEASLEQIWQNFKDLDEQMADSMKLRR